MGGWMDVKSDKIDLVIIAVIGVAVVAIIAAFFGGFIFGGKGTGIHFGRDASGRIETIMRIPSIA